MKNRIRNKTFICCTIICILFSLTYFGMAFYVRDELKSKYDEAVALFQGEQYSEAKTIFDALGNYNDSYDYSESASNYISYNNAKKLLESGQNKEAAEQFIALGDFECSADLAIEAKYQYGIELFSNGLYDEATKIFLELNDYKDSQSYAAKSLLPSVEDIQETVYLEALDNYENKEFSTAYEQFIELKNYKDSAALAQKCHDILERLRYSHTLAAGVRGSMALTGIGKTSKEILSNNRKISFTGDIPTKLLDFSDWGEVISISYFGEVVAGLREDGTVIVVSTVASVTDSWKDWEDIIDISTGEQFVVGLTSSGHVVGTGANRDKQIDVENLDWENIVAIATAWRRTVGLDSSGEIHMTGYGSGQLDEIRIANQRAENSTDENIKKKAWNNIIAIATGGGYNDPGHTVGLKSDGTVVAVGNDDYGQCSGVENWENIVAIAAGDHHTVGLRKDGRVVIAGDFDRNGLDDTGTIAKWEKIVAIAANRGYTLGLTDDGHVTSIGYDAQEQRPNSDSTDWMNIVVYKEWPTNNK